MRYKSLTIAAALAVSAGGSTWLGTGSAYAEVPATCTADLMGMTCIAEVLPGLTCNAGGWTTCTNTTNTDYTVIETVDCPGGTYVRTEMVPRYEAGEGSTMKPETVVRSADPSVEHSRIFVPANNSGLGPHGTGCTGDPPTSVRYFLEEPVAPAPPPPG